VETREAGREGGRERGLRTDILCSLMDSFACRVALTWKHSILPSEIHFDSASNSIARDDIKGKSAIASGLASLSQGVQHSQCGRGLE